MNARVIKMPRLFGAKKIDLEEEVQYAGYDAEIECMMACVEELARLEGRKGKDARNGVMNYLIERFNREDQSAMEQA